MTLRAGELDRRVTIQTFYETQNSSGEAEKTWFDLEQSPRVWASKRQVAAREQLQGAEVQAVADVAFQMRYRRDLSVEMRLLCDDEVYCITSISEIGRREALELLAQRVQS